MLNAIILASLVKVNLECKNPWIPTCLLVAVAFLLGLMFGYPILVLLIGAVINAGLGFLYFWLLKRTEDSAAWWAVMVVGILLFLGLGSRFSIRSNSSQVTP